MMSWFILFPIPNSNSNLTTTRVRMIAIWPYVRFLGRFAVYVLYNKSNNTYLLHTYVVYLISCTRSSFCLKYNSKWKYD